MTTIATNIINELREIDQFVFTKEELINIVKKLLSINNRLILESNGIELNPDKYHVSFNGVNSTLPRKEFELLYYLMSNKNKVMRREHIIRDVWGTDVWVGDRTIDVHIRKLRSYTQYYICVSIIVL